jgi:hypothetical protein
MNEPNTFSYPPGTYENLLFPTVSVPQPPEVPTENMNISVTVPGMRPALSCVRLSPQDLTFRLSKKVVGRMDYELTVPKSIPSVRDINRCGMTLLKGCYAYGKNETHIDPGPGATAEGPTPIVEYIFFMPHISAR